MPELRWALKRSFVGYVSGMPDGAIVIDAGAAIVTDGFSFPLASELDPLQPSLRFAGSLRFTAHGGMLDLTVADPWVDLTARDSGVVTIATRTGRVALVEFALAAAVSMVEGRSVRLLASAVPLFKGVYAEGEAFDDFSVLGLARRSAQRQQQE